MPRESIMIMVENLQLFNYLSGFTYTTTTTPFYLRACYLQAIVHRVSSLSLTCRHYTPYWVADRADQHLLLLFSEKRNNHKREKMYVCAKESANTFTIEWMRLLFCWWWRRWYQKETNDFAPYCYSHTVCMKEQTHTRVVE